MKTLRKKTRPIAKDKTVVSRNDLDWKLKLNVGPPKEDPTNKSEPVSVLETSERIAELLDKWPLEMLGRQIALGGYFHSDVFQINGDEKAAIILWFCYNPSNRAHPQLFVVAEKVSNFSENDPAPAGPVNEPLYRPIKTFEYDNDTNNSYDTLAFMRNARNPGITLPSQTILKSHVEEYVSNFKVMMSAMEVLCGAKFSQFPYAAFGNNKFYKAFMDREHKYVTYFFTLYFDTGHQPNYFRPVLGLTDQYGKLVETTTARLDEPMLQKSWPPPPNEQ